ncbi:MAG: M81 family metallopeptidase [Granulosicoccus sp.]
MTKQRIAIGGMQHETNTFAPLRTELEHFTTASAWPGLIQGNDILSIMSGRNIPISGFIEAVGDWELVPLLWTFAEPAGYVTDKAFNQITQMLIDALQNAHELDGVYLDLHGAMVSESHEDGEAEILRLVREVVGEDLPVVVSLDLHGNLSPEFFERASAVTIYRTYPHLDMAETGARAQLLLSKLLDKKMHFHKAWRQLDYIIPITSQSTMLDPARALYSHLQELTVDGVASIDMALGFPPADIAHTGASVFAYGPDEQAVEHAADSMLEALSQAEGDFDNPLIPSADAVKKAIVISRISTKPVVIADPQDNPGAGGMGDTTGLLHALLDEGAQGAALSLLWDEQAAALAHSAGVGSRILFSLGCKYPEYGNPPVQIHATVESVSNGIFEFTGPMYAGSKANFGPCACLLLDHDIAEVRVIVGTIRSQNADQSMFRALGVEPTEQKILVVKSAVHFLNDYASIAAQVIFAEATGANPCNLNTLKYTRLREGVKIGPCGKIFSKILS